MAVLARANTLRRTLERSRDAREQAERAKKARQAAEDAASAVGEALQEAADETDEDGTVPSPVADAVHQAIEAEATARQAARAAVQALTAAAPAVRAAARNAVAKAAEGARQETALMRAWGVGPGEPERMPFDQRARLAERLRTGRLAEWAELIGRFRQMADGERARKVENATGELVGVTSATTSPASSPPNWPTSAGPHCARCSPRATPPGS